MKVSIPVCVSIICIYINRFLFLVICDHICVYMGMSSFEYRDLWSPEEGFGALAVEFQAVCQRKLN